MKLTGPGHGKVLPSGGILLFNFDVSGAGLKAEHYPFLQMYVEPVLKRGGSVTIIGLASRPGPRAFNLDLSRRRANGTLAYLRGRVRNDFKCLTCRGYGEKPAMNIHKSEHDEDPQFRSVLLYTSNSPNPPPARPKNDLSRAYNRGLEDGIDFGDKISRGIDVAVGLSGLIELLPVVGEIAGEAGLLFTVVGGIAGMPLLWWSVHHTNIANGTIKGFSEAFQDMANQYNDPDLEGRSPSKWPPLREPRAHAMSSGVATTDKEWMEGKRKGVKVAYELIRQTEGQKTKNGQPAGRRFLFDLYQEFGDGVGEAILKACEKKLGKEFPFQ